jgi:hypothetical protein
MPFEEPNEKKFSELGFRPEHWMDSGQSIGWNGKEEYVIGPK